MKAIPYAFIVSSLMYAMLRTKPSIHYAIDIVSRYQSNPEQEHWIIAKYILKYLRRTKDYMLVYHSNELIPIGYTDSNF